MDTSATREGCKPSFCVFLASFSARFGVFRRRDATKAAADAFHVGHRVRHRLGQRSLDARRVLGAVRLRPGRRPARSRNARARRHLRLVRGRRVSSAHSPSSPPPGAPRPTPASPRPARSGPFLSLFSSKIDHMRPSSGLAPSPERVGASSIKVEIMSNEMQKHLELARAGDVEVERGVLGGDEDGGRTTAANEAQMSTRARVSRSRRSAARPQTHCV